MTRAAASATADPEMPPNSSEADMQTKTPLSVAARLSIAFGLVIALLCGSAVLAILRMAQINDASTEVTTNWLPSSIVTSALNDAAAQMERLAYTESVRDLARGAAAQWAEQEEARS